MPTELGQNIVVQGGTFYNDAVLRSFETISGCKAIRPDIAGIMGAFGAALIARDRYEGKETTMLSIDQINDLKFETKLARCERMYQQLSAHHQQILRKPSVHYRKPM